MQTEENLNDEAVDNTEEVETSAGEISDQSDEVEAADTSTQADDDSEATEESTEDKPKGGIQKRFDRLTARAKTAESERDYWKNLAQEKIESIEEPSAPKLPDPNLRYENPEEYAKQEAKFHEDLKAFNQSTYKYSKQQAEAEAREQESALIDQQVKADFDRSVAAVKESLPDWEEVVTANTNPVSDNMAAVAMRSEKGAEVLYELAKNPEQALRIYHMNPIQTAYEMGKIESRLAVKPKTTTSAPKPVTNVSSKGEKAVQSMSDMSMDDYAKEYWKQVAAQRT